MKNNPQISIIVPVYNVEKYLEACLDSLLGQTFENIEILCINDGSADKSLAILRRYEKRHSRLRVFNQANAGPAKARNVGLENASGEYIMFCDADDTYEPQMCEKMLAAITDNDVDLVMCNTNAYDKQGANARNEYYFRFNDGLSLLTPEIKLKTNVYLWNKIFKKSKIDAFQIKFPNGHKSDDNYFIYVYLMVSKTIYCLDDKLYNHYERENSIMNIYNNDNGIKYCDIEDKIDIIEMTYDFLIKHHIFQPNEETFLKIFFQLFSYSWGSVSDQWKEQYLQRCADFISRTNIKTWSKEPVQNILINHIKEKKFFEASAALDKIIKKNYNIIRRKYIAQPDLYPAFSHNNIPLVFNCDNNFVKYLSVTIQSIINNSSSQYNYDIIILNEDILDDTKEQFQHLIKDKKNFSIRFFNMKKYVSQYNMKNWFVSRHVKMVAYFRIFIADILQHFNKAIYLDSDVILNTDIATLYNVDIENYAVGAVRDFVISNISKDCELSIPGFYLYAKNILNISNLNHYFNSGVMLLNIKKINDNKLVRKMTSLAQENNYMFWDQDIYNKVLSGNVKLLDESWNTQINSGIDILSSLYMKPIDKIKILHFCSSYKPWTIRNLKYSYLWWHYARMTPFYEEILFKNLNSQNRNANNAIDLTLVRETANYLKNKITYWRYRLLSKITFGKKRRKYKQKRKELKTRLKQVRAFLKGK